MATSLTRLWIQHPGRGGGGTAVEPLKQSEMISDQSESPNVM